MAKTVHFYAYGSIGDSPEDCSPEKVLAFLSSLDDGVTDITVHINSYGGSVYSGFNIHEQFANSGKEITTIAEGICASIATVIFLAGTTRKITENTQLMVHAPMTSIFMEQLNAAELIERADELKAVEDRMAAFYVAKTGMTKKKVNELLSTDSWIDAKEAVSLKLATEIAIPLKAVAYLDTNKKHTPMADTKKDSLIKRITSLITDHFKAEGDNKIIAASAKLQDSTLMYFEGTLAEKVNVFSDEAMTIAMKDGSHLMADGSTVSVEGGSVKQITPAMAAETPEQLKAKITELETKNSTLEKEVKEMETASVDAVKEALAKIKSEYKPAQSATTFTKKGETLAEFEERTKTKK